MANHLAAESSPYLLQHRHNPVDWYPWGPAALAHAAREDKPIFLSIGYSACHWCHVMEHESFENAELAAQLNEHFVAIKVDREERPDLDQIYMNAVQALTGRGGWPMSVFLTPELKPFFGGTYWPPAPRMGMPGFGQVLTAVADAWKNRREDMLAGAQQLTDRVRLMASPPDSTAELSLEMLHGAAAQLQRAFDNHYGGFGRAPKFPHPMDLQVLLRHYQRWRGEAELAMVTLTLDRMAAGGIYDHLGGGFARYSVDERWLVPHFEKMLYDNALLAGVYLDAHLATGRPDYAQVVRETLDYLLRDMTDPAGGIYSTEDADSEGVEGKFYVWTPAEIADVLGPERAKTFCYVYDVSPAGNFEEHNILNLPKTLAQCAQILSRDAADLARELATARAELFAARERRVHPGRDDKVLVSWNGLAIDVLARAAGVLDEPRYLAAAAGAADFLLTQLRAADGRLLHTWRLGNARLAAYLDDYAALANALVSLYEASFEERFVDEAVQLADVMLARFADPDRGGFFYTADDHEQLIARTKDLYDGSVPSGNSLAATALLRLGKLCGRTDYLVAAERTLESAAGLMFDSPSAAGQMLLALDLYLGPTPEIVLLPGADREAIVRELQRRFIPRKVVALRSTANANGSQELDPIFAGKTGHGDQPALYICQDFACQTPVIGREAIVAAWDKLAAEPD